ncbi:Hsp20/alpha crystallin family protein [Achromobacter insolitus]|uniref:Spore protein SP21 n=1 Tax=Achromobacter insolitus TaxID=217204 RepID=A0A6S7F4P8_9BURK|nr:MULTISPECIES: Hsp20/alpha crystallin family protein [Achromobacter]APX78929.1 heat-shock protein Hsp20 [Achromobacter insolitus]AVG43809.1 Hsp20/alpha crystallin family protein [Achromobacter insolitus]AXA74803.1 heat-shock protein Hsp20 [Achromobacter insolitus]MCP1405253.1 HSP20 family molecular chaperone IbpA [Achromobacter insolitus]MDH3066378.1 Hsp20/alpha crystallin family protein [Achromobacter insolitus]
MNERNKLVVEQDGRSKEQRPATLPAVDIFEDATGVTVIADLPGVTKERLNVKVESEMLVIEGEASVQVPSDVRLIHGELREPLFRRSFRLGPEFDKDAISASLKQGILTLRVPRVREAQPRRIPVTVL